MSKTVLRREPDGTYLVLKVLLAFPLLLLALLLLAFRKPSPVSLEPLNQEILFPQLGLELQLGGLRRCELPLEGGVGHVR